MSEEPSPERTSLGTWGSGFVGSGLGLTSPFLSPIFPVRDRTSGGGFSGLGLGLGPAARTSGGGFSGFGCLGPSTTVAILVFESGVCRENGCRVQEFLYWSGSIVELKGDREYKPEHRSKLEYLYGLKLCHAWVWYLGIICGLEALTHFTDTM